MRQVIIVHRHGARFPTKPIGPSDISWPQNKGFWEKHGGQLTPKGSKMLSKLGKEFHACYVGGPAELFENVESAPAEPESKRRRSDSSAIAVPCVVDGSVVESHTSNVQRTLHSAWSFQQGFLKEMAPVFFTFRTDRVVCDNVRRQLGVPIFIQDAMGQDDKLFHSWKSDAAEYKRWQENNLRRSSVFMKAARDPAVQQLIEKLFKATGNKKLHPPEPKPGEEVGGAEYWFQRLNGAKQVHSAMEIQETHGQPVLPNAEGIVLEPHERDALAVIAAEHKRCWFQDAARPSLRDRSFGGSCREQSGAAILAHDVWAHMEQRASGRSKLRFVEYSCHDTTVAALASSLGVELPGLGFACYFVFELHEGDVDHAAPIDPAPGAEALRSPRVRVFYNPHPAGGHGAARVGLHELEARRLPSAREPHVLSWGELTFGDLSLAELATHCRLSSFVEARQAIADLSAVMAAPPQEGFQRLRTALATCRRHFLEAGESGSGAVASCSSGHALFASTALGLAHEADVCDVCDEELDEDFFSCRECPQYYVCRRCHQGPRPENHFRQLFDAVDVDRSGRVRQQEVAAMLSQWQLFSCRDPQLVSFMWRVLGKGENEALDYTEFELVMHAIVVLSREEHILPPGHDRFAASGNGAHD